MLSRGGEVVSHEAHNLGTSVRIRPPQHSLVQKTTLKRGCFLFVLVLWITSENSQGGAMYKTTVALQCGMKEFGPFNTFAEAFTAMVSGVNKMLEEGTTRQMLDTAVFIEREESGRTIALDFYDSKDLAYDCGLMRDGKLVDSPPSVDDRLVAQRFESQVQGRLEALVSEQEAIIRLCSTQPL